MLAVLSSRLPRVSRVPSNRLSNHRDRSIRASLALAHRAFVASSARVRVDAVAPRRAAPRRARVARSRRVGVCGDRSSRASSAVVDARRRARAMGVIADRPTHDVIDRAPSLGAVGARDDATRRDATRSTVDRIDARATRRDDDDATTRARRRTTTTDDDDARRRAPRATDGLTDAPRATRAQRATLTRPTAGTRSWARARAADWDGSSARRRGRKGACARPRRRAWARSDSRSG